MSLLALGTLRGRCWREAGGWGTEGGGAGEGMQLWFGQGAVCMPDVVQLATFICLGAVTLMLRPSRFFENGLVPSWFLFSCSSVRCTQPCPALLPVLTQPSRSLTYRPAKKQFLVVHPRRFHSPWCATSKCQSGQPSGASLMAYPSSFHAGYATPRHATPRWDAI